MNKIYYINAGGFYTIGSAVVVAKSGEAAAAMANEASDRKYKLTYFTHNATEVEVTSKPVGVLNVHEWGMPELPSKGSGIKVTF